MLEHQSQLLRIFLCHSSGDKSAVRELCHRLRNDGFDPWLDEEELLPGQDWQEEIPRAVRACDVVVVCLSRACVSKEGYLQREIKVALSAAEEKPEGTIFIIPVRLEEVDVPRSLAQWQWANLFQQDGYERLVRALGLRVAKFAREQIEAAVQRQKAAPVTEKTTAEFDARQRSEQEQLE